MGGDLLVAVDELVGLGAAQRPAPAQLLEAAPARARARPRRRRCPRGHCSRRAAVAVDALTASMSDVRPLLGDDDLVTGEAVALDLPPATVGVRLASGLIDVLAEVVLLVAGLPRRPVVVASGADDALLAVATLVSTVAGAGRACRPRWRRSPAAARSASWRSGCAPSATTPGRSRSGTRSSAPCVGVVEIWVFSGVPALVCALVTPRGKRLGDVVAGTYVVRERFPFPRVPAGADAAAPGRLGGDRRHRPAARRARARGAPVPRPGGRR